MKHISSEKLATVPMSKSETPVKAAPKSEPIKYKFFVTHPVKMAILAFASVLLYFAYWEYKNWQAVKTAEKSDTRPFWRAVLNPVFTYSLLKKMGFSDKRAKLTIIVLIIPALTAVIWPQIWWVWILAIPSFVSAQVDYNKRNNLSPKLMFTLRTATWGIIGIVSLAALFYSGAMTKPYNTQTSSTETSQSKKQTNNDGKEQHSAATEEKPAGIQENPEQPTEENADESAAQQTADKPSATQASPKVAATPQTPKAAAPQPPKKTSYQILYGGRLNTSVQSIHIQRYAGLPAQTFTISSPDGKPVSYPQTVGSSIWLASRQEDYKPGNSSSYTMFAQTSSVPNGTYTVNFEALHSTDDATWRYTGSILVYITD